MHIKYIIIIIITIYRYSWTFIGIERYVLELNINYFVLMKI